MLTLRRNLDKLCKYLASTYSINFGGCCFVAAEIAKHLDKLKIKYTLVVESNAGKNVVNIKEEIRSRVHNRCDSDSLTGSYTGNHYYIHIVGIGDINKAGRNLYPIYKLDSITGNDIEWLYKNSNWNDEYDTEYNEAIKNYINSFFIPYEKGQKEIYQKGRKSLGRC